jgi:predicted ATPase
MVGCGRWSRARATVSWRGLLGLRMRWPRRWMSSARFIESRGDGVRLRLRIALHTGEAQRRDEGNYFGRAVNRCARLRAIAHGDQVVLSRTVRDLSRDRLPENAELVDLGVHRLRDLGQPEQVFGLVHPELPAEFPPLRSLESMPNNLPGELTTFIGRRSELTQIGQLLKRARLLTLTGAGGCGKTRLALQAAADALDGYPDGVWWVELARLQEPTLFPIVMINALKLRELRGRRLVDTLVEYLRLRRALLVVDNCEHLLAACAELVDALLRSCPLLTMLATSRSPLGVPGEITWRVPSMTLPAEPARESIESLRQWDAVSLFIDRAMQVRPNFAMTATTAPVVAQICYDLDGIPLAIELAAARVRMMAPEQICSALSDRFRVLTGGARTVMPRQQTLQASLDWSYELLSEGERILLRRLAVFAGGWTLDAAEQVCSDELIDRYAVLDLLTGLVDKSLITTEEEDSQTRYGLLESVRQYANARLAQAGETECLRQRHLAYYLRLVEDAEPQVLGAGCDDPILQTLAVELPNLRAALDKAATSDPDTGLRLVNALTLFWLFTGRYQEGDVAYARALTATDAQSSLLRGRVLAGRGHLALLVGGAYQLAHGSAQTALETGQSCGDLWTQGRALNTLGFLASLDNPASGRPQMQRSAELAAQTGDHWGRINSLQCLAYAWAFQDDFDVGRPILDEAYVIATELGYRWGLAWHWLYLGWQAIYQGRLTEGRELLERAVAASDEVGNPITSGLAKGFITRTYRTCGETELAYSLATDNLKCVHEAGAGFAWAMAYQELGKTETAMGRLAAAREHLQAGNDLPALGTVERLDGNLDLARMYGQEARTIARQAGRQSMQADAERLLSRLALAAGEASEAERHAHDALARLAAKGFALDVPECLDLLAAAAAAQESFDEAARLLGAAMAGRQRLGIVRVPPEPEFWTDLERTVRDALGEGYHRAYTEGVALGLEEAVAYVRRARG